MDIACIPDAPDVIKTRIQTPQGVSLASASAEPGIEHVEVRVPAGAVAGPVMLEWFEPLVDIAGKWHCAIGADRSLTAEWTGWLESYATHNAPVMCAFSAEGANRLTFALSDAVNPLKLQMQVEEDTAELRCRVLLRDRTDLSSNDEYVVTLRIDRRPVAYHRALAEVAAWWAAMPEYRPAAVPPSGFEPVYSTWYGFHQKLAPDEIEDECRWAKALGCGAVIVDDGWQCDDSNKGYDFCGDWKIAASKFSDFPGHVARIQAIGLRYLLWFSVPFAGPRSEAWARFRDRLLDKPVSCAPCLDPRYSEVREFLIGCYRRAVEEWGVDGLKLDFVDRFTAVSPGASSSERADFVSVPEAADRLLTDAITTLRTVRPDVLIEFRQKYVGPAMRKYGHLFRANDCPNDGWSNRVRTIDVRLLAGDSAVHSDMIMWHRDESPERVAAQLWAALFSVPQISLRRATITPEQERVLAFFLGFWREHRELLMTGELEPLYPLEHYPVVRARRSDVTLIACYADRVVCPGVLPAHGKLVLVNATARDRVVLDCASPLTVRAQRVLDCAGQELAADGGGDWIGLHAVFVPVGGVCKVSF